MRKAAAASLVGVTLDRRYRVDAIVGAGENGAWVFRARDTTSGEEMAVRCPGIPEDLAGLDYEQALDAFLGEAKTLARASLMSDDLERLLGYGIAEPRGRDGQDGRSPLTRVPFCVFEWLEGKSLAQHIGERAGGVLSISEALAILEPAARGLAAAHALGIAHRDVRPKNLWLASVAGRTRMKVTQFALASRVGPSNDAFAPEYGAPEHFKRSYGAVGPHTDVYGLALSLIELVSGTCALHGTDATELYLASSDLGRRPTLRARGVEASSDLEAVIARALAVDPRRRWQNAREFWDALVLAVPELTPAVPSVHPREVRDAAKEVPATSGDASVPSMWAPREQSVALPIPVEDARLIDIARSIGATREPETPRDRSSVTPWLVVGAVAIAAVALVSLRIGRAATTTPPLANKHAPAASTGSGASAGAPPSASARDRPPSDERAVRLQPFLTDMIRVSAGTWTMGTNKEGHGDGPAHPVTITKAFYIDRTEATAKMYYACIEEGTCTPIRVHADNVVEGTWGCNTAKDNPHHPINCVDRGQAARFCAYAKKRLPTEAEWEYAARGSDGRDFPWGSVAPTSCVTAALLGLQGDCKERKGTSEVGAAAEGRSAFGAMDMAGNVWEWVSDGYEPYRPDSVTDPHVPLTTPHAKGILRGGSWDSSASSAKATYRYPFQANVGNISTGFRCAHNAID